MPAGHVLVSDESVRHGHFDRLHDRLVEGIDVPPTARRELLVPSGRGCAASDHGGNEQ